MLQTVLDLIQIDGQKIIIDDSKINLFEYYDEPIPDWEPRVKLKPFAEIKQAYFDIESTGIDPLVDEVVLIGVIDEKDNVTIFEGRERLILKEFFDYVTSVKPEILAGYNNFQFDLPFLICRADRLDISHPFWVSPQKTTHRTAVRYNQPQQYHDIYVNGKETAIIDLYNQVLSWDFVYRKLLQYGLKTVPIDMGLRSKDDRIYLNYREMLEIIKSGDLTRLKEYLIDDLKDTKLIGNHLIPSIYYQKMFLTDWSLQKISNKGNGRKWNDLIKYEYVGMKFYVNPPTGYKEIMADNEKWIADLPDPDPSMSYEGGYTFGMAGLFLNVARGDLASMYPNLMLTYGICSRKDPKKITLAILKYLTKARLIAKDLAKKGDKDAEEFQSTVKVLINSCYGALASLINFNDVYAAAIVTAYGRALIKYINKLVERFNGKVIANDTDSVTYISDSTDLRNIHQLIQENLPQGASLALEWVAKAIYIPPSKDGVNGLRKNYIIFFEDGSIKASGKYRKRDRCNLEKQFQIEYLKRLINEGRKSADCYMADLINQIKNQKLPLEEIMITRNARKNEKDIFARGLVDQDNVTNYYMIDEIEVMKTKTKKVFSKGNTGEYSVQYYLNLVREMYNEMAPYISAVQK
jgi:DNA polymerase elongation subunit (family B)